MDVSHCEKNKKAYKRTRRIIMAEIAIIVLAIALLGSFSYVTLIAD